MALVVIDDDRVRLMAASLRGLVDETHLADTRTRSSDEDGLSEKTRGVEYGHVGMGEVVEAEETDDRMSGDGRPAG